MLTLDVYIHAKDTGVCAVSKGFIQTQQGCFDAPLQASLLPPNLPTLRKGDAPRYRRFICLFMGFQAQYADILRA